MLNASVTTPTADRDGNYSFTVTEAIDGGYLYRTVPAATPTRLLTAL
jgi:hypothetical protein